MMHRGERLRTPLLAVLGTAAAALALGACGGGGSTAASAGPTVTAGQTNAPQVFRQVNAEMQAAIGAAEPGLGQTTQQPGEFTAEATSMRQALNQWQTSGALPASQDVQDLTAAMQALVTDFSAPQVNRAQAATAIGNYNAAATRYQDAEHVGG
jgi:hypothetical protein